MKRIFKDYRYLKGYPLIKIKKRFNLFTFKSYYSLYEGSFFNLGGITRASYHYRFSVNSLFSLRNWLKEENIIKNLVREKRIGEQNYKRFIEIFGDVFDKTRS